LTTVLNVHKAKLDPDLVIDESVKLLIRKRGIVDLMLSRAQRRHRANDYEHLVIELKAPKVKLTAKELTQIKDYALSVANDPGSIGWMASVGIFGLSRMNMTSLFPLRSSPAQTRFGGWSTGAKIYRSA
jgi:hypothetical protein